MRLSAALLCSILLHGLAVTVHPLLSSQLPQRKLAYPARSLTITLVASSATNTAPTPPTAQEPQVKVSERGKSAIDAANPATPLVTNNDYLPVSELDVPPQIFEAPDLDRLNFGPFAEGTAMLRLWVGTTGKVDRLEVEKSTLPPEVDRYLVKSQRAFRLGPGRKNLTPVKSTIRFQITLSREATAQAQETPGRISSPLKHHPPTPAATGN